MRIKVFISYSHKDEKHKKDLETHLENLKRENIIETWCDRDIKAGDILRQKIEDNMRNSDVILLLVSPDFISSSACNEEMKLGGRLKDEIKITIIPIILRNCGWRDIPLISNLLALPDDGRCISEWPNKDEYWFNVYEGIKKKAGEIKKYGTPKTDFKRALLKQGPIGDEKLDIFFVYPSLKKIDIESNDKLNYDIVDSSELKKMDKNHIVISGEEQSGKTSLCSMLYMHYLECGFRPILIKGRDITGRAILKDIVEEKYRNQYDNGNYGNINKEKRILMLDDANECRVNKITLENLYH